MPSLFRIILSTVKIVLKCVKKVCLWFFVFMFVQNHSLTNLFIMKTLIKSIVLLTILFLGLAVTYHTIVNNIIW